MSFLKKREPDNRGVHRLPKQPLPPTLIQLQGMLQECTQLSGRTCQVTFGDAPEDYSLAVFKDRRKGDVHWALYRGQGDASMMVWDQPTSDPGFIHQLITAQFPGLDLKPTALRPTGDFQIPKQAKQDGQSASWTNARDQQATTLRMRGKPTYEGDLKNLALANVVQSIAMSKGTGRLEIEKLTESATIFFADGTPIHAVSRGLEGEPSLIELVGWTEGEFRFYPGAKHDRKTIKRRLDTLLMEGSAIDDQFQALRNLGGSDTAFPLRKHQALSEQEFEKILKSGTGAVLDLYKRIYLTIDGRTRLAELVHKLNLTKQQWVPVLFNLTSCDLIEFKDQLAGAFTDPEPEVNIDWSLAVAAEKSLTRSETGLYSYPAFLFFLKLELWRWERFGRPFSVILLQLSGSTDDSPGSVEPLTIPAIRAVGERVGKLKSKTDIMAHYETFGLALLLREADLIAANAFAGRLVEAISKEPLHDGLSSVSVFAKAGVACVPDDCSSLGALLARAKPRSMAEALAEARDKVRAVIDNALDVICSTDEELRLVEVNPACETALGYQPDELLGRPFASLLAAADVKPSLEKIQELISSPTGSRRVYLENRLVKKDGSTVHFQWSMRWAAEKRMLFWVGRDISAQKELERLKTDLIRTITHDLRSPAMAVDGFLEAIESELVTEVEHDWRPMHKAAQVASTRMIKLISDLLAYERISDAMVVLNYQVVPVSEIFAQSVASVATSPKVRIDVVPTDLMLKCDGDRVIQIVVNLLANAVKFSPAESVVTLAAAETDTQISISVTDRGPGIAPEFLNSVFLPFKQIADNNRGRSKGGFGLGLAIAKAFAELHGGNIMVESEVGKGSTFCLWLPKKQASSS